METERDQKVKEITNLAAELSFWNRIKVDTSEQSGKPTLKEFPTSPYVYHFHPIAFVEQMKRGEKKTMYMSNWINRVPCPDIKLGNIEFKVNNKTKLSIRGEDGRIYVPFNVDLVFGELRKEGENRIMIEHTGTHGYIDYKDNLHFRADKNWISALTLYGDGSVGVGFGTTYDEGDYLTDGCKLAVNGNLKSNGNIISNGEIWANNLCINHNATTDWNFASRIIVNRDLTKAFVITKNNTDMFAIYGNGIVAAKKIYAEAFEITANAMNIHWYDYVFDKNYKLRSLADLEQFIKANKHLPEIPSEKEVKENGINIGEMQGKLLLKVEELTLYVIEQQKLIEELQSRLSELESKKGGE